MIKPVDIKYDLNLRCFMIQCYTQYSVFWVTLDHFRSLIEKENSPRQTKVIMNNVRMMIKRKTKPKSNTRLKLVGKGRWRNPTIYRDIGTGHVATNGVGAGKPK